MSPTYNLITTSYCGGRTSITFDDRIHDGARPPPAIAKIVVGHCHYIFKLQVRSPRRILFHEIPRLHVR